MSVNSEIQRISSAVADAYDAVDDMGGTLPSSQVVANLADAIKTIPQGGGSAISVTEEEDVHGGIIKHINAVDLSLDTVAASHLEVGYTAHDRFGNPVVGTLSPGGGNIWQDENGFVHLGSESGGGGGGNGYSRTTIVTQQTVTPDSDRIAGPFSCEPWVVGGIYIVTLDGTEYPTTCTSLWDGSALYIGSVDLYFSTTSDEVYPFTGGYIIADGTCEFVFNDMNQHTIKMERVQFLDAAVLARPHTIHLEFMDGTDTDIDVYYDDTLIQTMITAYTPAIYGGKTVALAELDDVVWYQPASIPLNTELIDYTKVSNNTAINQNAETFTEQWYYTSDYTPVSQGMTFTYTAGYWFYIGLYDSLKDPLGTIYVFTDSTVDPNDGNTGHGTLSGNELPSGVAYVRLCGTAANNTHISLIRTA